jgi:RNA polymerase sigma-70 factor, ECF subfamily
VEEWRDVLEGAGGESLRTYVRRTVGSAEVTEDILQDTYEKFLRHVGRGKRASRSWLRKVAFHLTVSHFRQLQRHPEVVLAEEAPELATAPTVVESEAERREIEDWLSLAVRTLSTEQKNLIDLHYWQGMSVGEIAAKWGKSEEAVQQRLTRALNRLRAAMLSSGTNTAGLANTAGLK